MKKIRLMQGNEACVEGAIAAGCRFYAGYPITPSTEIAEGCAVRMPQVGGHFIQMEDEIAGCAAAVGASAAGVKSMTATSGPGFSLKQENLGYACITEIPFVLVDVQRAGPSTGLPTSPSQGDVMQAKWGTHGDHPVIAIAPSSVEECYRKCVRCFNLAEKYRTPVIFLMDEIVGHLRESIEIPEESELEIINRSCPEDPTHTAPAYSCKKGELVPCMAPFGSGERYNITGLIHGEDGFPTNSTKTADAQVKRLIAKIEENLDDILEWEEDMPEDAETCIVCYGGTARSVYSAVEEMRNAGEKVGFFRPITVWPFPVEKMTEISKKVKKVVVVEHNNGQLVLEVERVIKNNCALDFLGKVNGTVITPDEVIAKVKEG
ncbi:MAG: 2-oxoacid:acceptor oxidoreductase subunit alpha [Ruminococcaceae bacterium]|nr:2-oxoacid:acceptor oxidoreductase subunit alpha [Oscillospiraceae bacterium]